jgi:hypothetical protein
MSDSHGIKAVAFSSPTHDFEIIAVVAGLHPRLMVTN